ncbi:unnamed protein product [Symbiodinium natans]|uniref:Uncharacterized protein n=1 Tax=Symbiodinium natans TaxID=878477 RepID=A0A812GXT2_9DINO|nr:unnamed protein product [Symbiodinium natans]
MSFGEPMYITALDSRVAEPLYITVSDGRVKTTLARNASQSKKVETTYDPHDPYVHAGMCRTGSDSDFAMIPCKEGMSSTSLRCISASSRCSSSDSTTCSAMASPDDNRSETLRLLRRPSSPQCKAPMNSTRLLWCEGNAEGRMEQMQALADQFYCGTLSHFSSPSSFTRWFFEQGSRPVAELGAVLVAGWREAKPCGAAIKAGITGETGGLRKDCKRPEQWDRKLAAGAVRAMIILPENPKHSKRASDWIRSETFLSQILEFRVVETSAELPRVLAELSDARGRA